jgi:GalNAc-alpha-(1->4)-GalNAc-alpha-(1->3)-diNAcBac-PP-undecaprenol alpha-1,4-N-acetyl-D-galactosaminyltransferase
MMLHHSIRGSSPASIQAAAAEPVRRSVRVTPRRKGDERPFRLTAVIGSLVAGGAERIMAILTEAWAARGWNVELILTLAAPSEESFFAVDPRVKVRRLDLYRPSPLLRDKLRGNLRRLQVVRRAIRASRPDVIVAFMVETNVVTTLATRGLRVPVVVEEHIYSSWPPLPLRWRLLRFATYPLASSVVALTPSALSTLGLAQGRRGRVIPNPVLPAPPGDVLPADPPVMVAMGRLVPQKGFDMLLDAFAVVARTNPDWNLEVWGEGPDRVALERRRDSLGLTDRVTFPGTTQAPYDVLRRAGFFVLSSRREGFPTVLGEAMASGIPAVSFDCPSGPRELIRDGVDGLLVPSEDVAALAAGMDRLIADPDLRARLASRAPDVVERFSLDAVLERWDDIFVEVGALPAPTRARPANL